MQIIGFSIALVIGIGFWTSFCQGSLGQCLDAQSPWDPILFLLLAMVRPFLFTPTFFLAVVAGNSFNIYFATLLTALGVSLSVIPIYYIGRLLGVYGVQPWLSANLPATWQLLKTHDYKLAFFTRWVPVFPFDLFSLLFGVGAFNLKRTLLATFLGSLPEAYVFTKIAQSPESEGVGQAILNLIVFGLVTITPLLIFEFLWRKKGSSLWLQAKRTYFEIVYEIRSNNEIIRRREYDNSKIPVILLYGFFSSRKSLIIMERLLNQRGFQVMSFNLGGLLGVFFTRGIKETATYIDRKISTQFDRHKFKKIQLVGHSKGGLVALWWLLKLGGHRYCDKVITMGTPFHGTYLTYLGLMTPIGFIWRDLWQMRPGSQFLKELHNVDIPKNLSIYCCYSDNDKVATGIKGKYVPKNSNHDIQYIPLHHVTHFEFLYRRDVADKLARLLRQKPAQVTLGPSKKNESLGDSSDESPDDEPLPKSTKQPG